MLHARLMAARLHRKDRRETDPLWQYKALPNAQRDFLKDLMATWDGVMRVLAGGNRSGKTETGAWAFAHYARYLHLCRPDIWERDDKPVLWWVSKSYEDAGEIVWKQKLKLYIPSIEIEPDGISWVNKKSEWPKQIRLKNGVTIVVKSSEQGRAAMQGKAIAALWFDEQCPEDVMKEATVRCTDYGSPRWMSVTPVEPDVHLEERYTEQDPDWRFWFADFADNAISKGGHIPDEEVDRFLRAIEGTDMEETRRRGAFAGFEGSVFKAFRREVHTHDFSLDDVRKLPIHACGVDFGTAAPFSCVWGAYDPATDRWWIYQLHYEARANIDRHIDVMKEYDSRAGLNSEDVLRWCDTGDEAGKSITEGYKTSGRRELRRAGFNVQNARKDRWRGIESIQRRLVVRDDGLPGLVIAKECRALIKEMIGYRYPTATEKQEARNTTMGPDHAIDAMRYLIFSENRSPESAGQNVHSEPKQRAQPATMKGTKLGTNPLLKR